MNFDSPTMKILRTSLLSSHKSHASSSNELSCWGNEMSGVMELEQPVSDIKCTECICDTSTEAQFSDDNNPISFTVSPILVLTTTEAVS